MDNRELSNFDRPKEAEHAPATEERIDIFTEGVADLPNILSFPVASNEYVSEKGILYEIYRYPGFRELIALCAGRAELEAIHDANQPYRTVHHRGIRAQQQMLQHLGNEFGSKLGFQVIERTNQKFFVAPQGFFSQPVQFIHSRARQRKSGFILQGKGRIQTRQLTDQNQLSLDFWGKTTDEQDSTAIDNQTPITILILTCPLGEEAIGVHLFLPLRHKGKRWHGESFTCYNGLVGMSSSQYEQFGDEIPLSPNVTIPEENDAYVQEIEDDLNTERHTENEVQEEQGSQTGTIG